MLSADHPAKPGEKAHFGEGFVGYEAERAEQQQVMAVQEALIVLGYELEEADGAAGPKTVDAIKKFQRSQGLKADGKPSAAVLERMQSVAREKGMARPAGAAPAP
jgi:peptidoglycan hydrolase-like protein with peptidoglycan-binding domain